MPNVLITSHQAFFTKEALNNTIKHSNATKITITVKEHPGFYQLLLEDNGTNTSSKNTEIVTDTTSSEPSSKELTETEAKKIALAQVPGATESDIREFEVDYDDGRLEYDGSIYYGDMEYEFEIDGYSGAIRSWEVESIYD